MISDKSKSNIRNLRYAIILTSMIYISINEITASNALPNEIILNRRWRDLETSRSLIYNPSFSAFNEKFTGTFIFSKAQLCMFDLYNVQCTRPFSAKWDWGLTLGLNYTGFSSGDIERTSWQNGNINKYDTKFDYKEHYGTINAAIFIHEKLVKRFHFLKDIAFGINLNGAYKSNFDLPITDISLDLGLSRFFTDTSIFSKNIIGLGLLNPFSISVNDFSNPLYTPNFGFSWCLQKKYNDFIFDGGIELDWRSFWDFRSDCDRKDVSLRIGVNYRLFTCYVQYGNDISGQEGNDYWGTALKVDIPSYQSRDDLKGKIYDPGEIDASFAYQFTASLPDKYTAQPTNSGYLTVAFGKSREDNFACGPFDIRFKICGNCNTLFHSAKLKLEAENYWHAYALFNFLIHNCPEHDSIPAARVYSALCLEKMHLSDYALSKYRDVRKYLTDQKKTLYKNKRRNKFSASIDRQIGLVDVGILRCIARIAERRQCYFNIIPRDSTTANESDTLDYRWNDSITVQYPDSNEIKRSDTIFVNQFKLLVGSQAAGAVEQEAFYHYGQYQLKQNRPNEAIAAFDTLTDKNFPFSAYAQYSKTSAYLLKNVAEQVAFKAFDNSLKFVDNKHYSELKNRILVKRAQYTYESLRNNLKTINTQNDSIVNNLKKELTRISALTDSLATHDVFTRQNPKVHTHTNQLIDSLNSFLMTKNDSLHIRIIIERETNTLLSENLRRRIDSFGKHVHDLLSSLLSAILQDVENKDGDISAENAIDSVLTMVKTMLNSTESISKMLEVCNGWEPLRRESDQSIKLSLDELHEIPETSHVYIEALAIEMWIYDLLKEWRKCEQTTEKVHLHNSTMIEEIKADAFLLHASILFRNQILSIIKNKNTCKQINQWTKRINLQIQHAKTAMNNLHLFITSNNCVDNRIDSLTKIIIKEVEEYNGKMQKTADLKNLISIHQKKIDDTKEKLLHLFLIRDQMKKYSGMLNRFNEIITDINWVTSKNSVISRYCQDHLNDTENEAERKKEETEINREIDKLKQQLEKTE